MPLYTIPNSTSGIDTIIVDTVAEVPSFIPLLLAFVFFTVWLGGMARQRARVGNTDPALWCTVASLITFMIALILSIPTGMISLTYLVVVFVVMIFSFVWLAISHRQSEM